MPRSGSESLEIDPAELRDWLEGREENPFRLIDCRETSEHALCRITGAELFPLSAWPEGAPRFGGDERVVVYCHHGMRSLRAVQFLRARGVPGAVSLHGGIDRWSLEIDPTVPRY